MIKAFDFNTTVGFMEAGGWRLPKFAAFMVTAAETPGGIGLLLGLLTPLAACAVIAAMIDAWAVNVSGGAFWSEPFNVPFLLAIGATALLFTGAGAYSVDARLFGRTTLVPSDRRRTADPGDRRRDADLDCAERDQPDPLQRPDQLKLTRR